MVDQSTIDRILDAAQIVDAASEFVTLRKRGGKLGTGLCPFHNEKTPSFSVHLLLKGVCKCFSCGKGGKCGSLHYGARNSSHIMKH